MSMLSRYTIERPLELRVPDNATAEELCDMFRRLGLGSGTGFTGGEPALGIPATYRVTVWTCQK